jgi:hypothetical protein
MMPMMESGVRRSVYIGASGRNLASFAMDMFSHLIYFTNFINVVF